MFDGVAGRYDLTNAILSGGNAPLWRIATTKAVDPKPGERVLDVACGTGTSTASLAKRGARVIGVEGGSYVSAVDPRGLPANAEAPLKVVAALQAALAKG